MKSEKEHLSWLRNELRVGLGAHVIKHDDSTAGVPDLSVSANGIGTVWIEVKHAGRGGVVRPNKKDFPLLQWATLATLSRFGPAVYAIFLEDERRMAVAWPNQIRVDGSYVELYLFPGTLDRDPQLSDMAYLLAALKGCPAANWDSRK